MKILLVEDNDSIILGLEYLLNEEGYQFMAARTYEEAVTLYGQEYFDLVLLDISLPDGNGFELCRRIKKEQELPVIFLTAKEEEKDVVQGFDVGADDYIQKPFRNRELISRIKNVLRRCGKDQEVLHCRFVKLDTRTGIAYSHGKEVSLTKLEY